MDITCEPIDSLEEVLGYMDRPPSWALHCLKYRPNEAHLLRNHDLHQPVKPNVSNFFCHYEPEDEVDCERYEEGSLPKTLICHDMANGYHDDRFVNGTSNSDAYHFYDWAAIDIFCYFSHHFITIPPLAWINAGHLHGTKVIGTVITEWKDGTAVWEKVLSSPEYYRKFADSLVAITKYLKFEGWLLNIENKISKPRMLLDFVRYFRDQLHLEIPGALLLWYDSVTIDGDLAWQNGLNDYNINFFRACDGIFTNYSWSEQNIISSASVASAEGRLRDVFVGIDVWGRNFYGGGHFNTVEAVKVAFRHGCSLAIFAPAWTYEAVNENERYPALGESLSSGRSASKYDQFLMREKAFWDSLWPYLNTRVPTILPFRTSFCRGNGQNKRRYGEVIQDNRWHNMKEIEHQPNALHGPHGYRLVKIEDSKEPKEYCRTPEQENQIDLINNIPDDSEDASNKIMNANDIGEGTASKRKEKEAVHSKAVRVNTNNENIQSTPIPDNVEVYEDGRMIMAEVVQHKVKQADDVKEVTIDTEVDAHQLLDCTNRTGLYAPTSGQFDAHPRKPPVVRYKLVIVPEEISCVEHYAHDSFNGGSCLIVQPHDVAFANGVGRSVRLFHCEFLCASKLIVYVVTKPVCSYEEQSLNIICTMKANESNKFNVVLIGCESDAMTSQLPEPYRELPAKSTRLKSVQKFLLTQKPGVYVPIGNDTNWKVRYFVLDWPGTTLTSISCRTSTPHGPILLGQIGVCPLGDDDSLISL